MNKPTLFFSHSSLDKKSITLIKDKILQKTSKTIEIFQSSDGESIPFGNNWVHKIEENLAKAKIMLVFISPNSINSNWIYFESGFSYSKGVKVIPIGINGINVGELKPPINLLQGFNITSHEGINNIISIINKEFNCEYPTDFNSSDYQQIANIGDYQPNALFSHSDDVDCFLFEYPKEINSNGIEIKLTNDPMKRIESCLIKTGDQYVEMNEKEIHMHGTVFRLQNKDNNTKIVVTMDPYSFAKNINLILAITDKIYQKDIFDKFWFHVCFDSSVKMINKDYKLSSRLYENGILMSDFNSHLFVYNNLLFAIDKREGSSFKLREIDVLRVVFKKSDFKPEDVFNLIDRLFDIKVIFKDRQL